jgi:hypothetical protein
MGAPVNLTSSDFAKLAPSGISPELAAQAQLRRVDSREGGAIVGRNGSRDYSGIVIPYFRPDQEGAITHRLRLDHPEIEYKDGKTRKKTSICHHLERGISPISSEEPHRNGSQTRPCRW